MWFSQELQQDTKKVLLKNQKSNSDPTILSHLIGNLYVKGVKFHLQFEYSH